MAEAAQTTVEKIMPYAAPVLAEREHVAERAPASSIRRPAGEPAGRSRTLGEAVGGRLRAMNVDPDAVVVGRLAPRGRPLVADRRLRDAGEQRGPGELTYDQPGNFVVLDNDDARWLVGERIEPAPRSSSAPRGRPARQRPPQPPYPSEQLPLGEDAAARLVSDRVRDLGAEQPIEAFLDDRRRSTSRDRRDETAEQRPLDDPAADEPPARRPVKKNRGRASVPSWDEIMFGGGDRVSRASSLVAVLCRVDGSYSPSTRPAMSYFVTGATGFIGRHPRPGARRPPRGHGLRARAAQGSLDRMEQLIQRLGLRPGRAGRRRPRRARPRRRRGLGRGAPGRRSTTSSTSPRSTT